MRASWQYNMKALGGRVVVAGAWGWRGRGRKGHARLRTLGEGVGVGGEAGGVGGGGEQEGSGRGGDSNRWGRDDALLHQLRLPRGGTAPAAAGLTKGRCGCGRAARILL